MAAITIQDFDMQCMDIWIRRHYDKRIQEYY